MYLEYFICMNKAISDNKNDNSSLTNIRVMPLSDYFNRELNVAYNFESTWISYSQNTWNISSAWTTTLVTTRMITHVSLFLSYAPFKCNFSMKQCCLLIWKYLSYALNTWNISSAWTTPSVTRRMITPVSLFLMLCPFQMQFNATHAFCGTPNSSVNKQMLYLWMFNYLDTMHFKGLFIGTKTSYTWSSHRHMKSKDM
jgi:hypothetical protein